MFPKNLSFYVGLILSTFTAKIRSQILQTHLGQKGSPLCPLTAYLNLPIHAATHLSCGRWTYDTI